MQEDSVLQRRYSYAERSVKKLYGCLHKSLQEAFGKYPQVEVDAEISEEPSVCFFAVSFLSVS